MEETRSADGGASGRARLATGIAAVVAVALLVVGVGMAGGDDDAADAPLVPTMAQACRQFGERPGAGPSDLDCCRRMPGRMPGREARGPMSGPMRGPMARGDVEQMRDACRAWSEQGGDAPRPADGWCDEMVAWMERCAG